MFVISVVEVIVDYGGVNVFHVCFDLYVFPMLLMRVF